MCFRCLGCVYYTPLFSLCMSSFLLLCWRTFIPVQTSPGIFLCSDLVKKKKKEEEKKKTQVQSNFYFSSWTSQIKRREQKETQGQCLVQGENWEIWDFLAKAWVDLKMFYLTTKPRPFQRLLSTFGGSQHCDEKMSLLYFIFHLLKECREAWCENEQSRIIKPEVE